MRTKTFLSVLRKCIIFLGIALQQLYAQDTLVVEWKKPDGSIKINALRDAVAGDTLVDGTRKNLNRTYVLRRGGLYWNDQPIVNTGFPLCLVGELPGTNAGEGPAIFQLTAATVDSIHSQPMIVGESSVSLRHLWITGADTSGVQSSYQPLQMNATNSRLEIDDCIFERSNFALIAFTGAHNDIYVTNCRFRNLIGNPSTQQWEGRGISIWADQDSVVIENCTFFNIGFTTFQVEGGSARYLRFNHNTVVNVGRGITPPWGNWWQNAYFANTLIINGWWEGEGYQDLHNASRDPRMTHSGLFTIGTLPSPYGPEKARRIVVTKTYAYLDPRITAKYGGTSDTIVRAWFFDPVSKLDQLIPYAVGGALDGHMFVRDTVWLSTMPAGMTDYLGDANWLEPKYSGSNATMLDSMWQNISMLRAGMIPAAQYVYHPAATPMEYTWPLPENFAYTDAPLMRAGTDGLPIGDLNWFPTQKAMFLANQTAYVKTIEDLAGPNIPFPIKDFLEAESGTLGGTAAQAQVQGLTYYEYNGAGSITWDFNVTTAGLYDTRWYMNMTGRGQSGVKLAIDSIQFVDRALGWEEFVFDPTQGPAVGLSNTAWVWVPIVADSVKKSSDGSSATSLFTLSAGTHTIGIESGGWGNVKFSGVDLIRHGTTDTIKLRAPDAVPYLVTPVAEGAKWLPSRFKYVSMGAAGTISWNVNASQTQCFYLFVFYQNTGISQSMQIREGSTLLTSFTLAAKSDSTGLHSLSGLFWLNAGGHFLTLSGADINVDYVQLVQGLCEGVEDNGPAHPVRFSLEQNYPNPFNPTTIISFSIPVKSFVTLKIFDMLGKEVAMIANEELQAGTHTRQWNPGGASSGVYFCRLQAGKFSQTRKLVLLR